jgi:acetylglutamate kinase
VKPVVIKLGGGALAGGALEDLPGILGSGREIALAHGGGLRLTRMLDALGIPTRFHEGLRVTDSETLEVAEMVFAGSVNKNLARELNASGVPAAGISGTDGPEPDLIHALWAGGFVPVVAPLGLGPEGAYNVNADAAAAALALGLGAEHLFLLTDVEGLLKDGAPVGSLAPDECEEYVASGLAAGGMVPKLRAAAEAARGGVSARIINGNREGALAAALAGEGVGTLISEGVVA